MGSEIEGRKKQKKSGETQPLSRGKDLNILKKERIGTEPPTYQDSNQNTSQANGSTTGKLKKSKKVHGPLGKLKRLHLKDAPARLSLGPGVWSSRQEEMALRGVTPPNRLKKGGIVEGGN